MDQFKQKLEQLEKIALITLVCITIMMGGLFGYITAQVKNFSGIDNLKQFQPSLPTKIYDVNGLLIAELFKEKRDLVPIDKLPRTVINAFIAAEDKDFYRHIGINPMAIARAMVKNIMSLKIVQGGSTITQQLAKRLFTKSERNLARKLAEAVLALQIEKKFTKDEILEMYLNQIYLGQGCYGVASAGKLFFNKEAKDLTLIESAILSALPSAPGRYSPLLNTRNAYNKNRDILNRLVESGFTTRAIAEKAYKEFWPTFVDSIKMEYPSKTVHSKTKDQAPYFTDYVRQILIARFGESFVYNEGLSIYTTLDLKRQQAADRVMSTALRAQDKVSGRRSLLKDVVGTEGSDNRLLREYSMLKKIFDLPGVAVKADISTDFKKFMSDDNRDAIDLITNFTENGRWRRALDVYRSMSYGISSKVLKVEGAMVAIEPKTGYITSMVGGTEYSIENQYNRAIQAIRQPGSSFKPFVYGAGIESGQITAATTLPDAPIINIDDQGRTWFPANYEGEFSGMIPLRRALAASINIISIRIFDLIGADIIIDYASRMLKVPPSRFAPNPTLALGTTEVSPFEMANGYAIYANRGRDVIPFAVRYVVDRDGTELVNIEEEVGNILAAKEMNGTIQIISPEVAFIMTTLMEAVVNIGTGNEGVRGRAGFTKRCAGKTGTTQDWTDAWFCGFTPDVAAVIWFGYDQPFMTLGSGQSGAPVAAPIWGAYMREIYKDMRDPVFGPVPKNVHQHGEEFLINGTNPGPVYIGEDYKMKSVLERYMEKEGVKLKDSGY